MKKLLLTALVASVISSSATAFSQGFMMKGRGGIAHINSSIKKGSRSSSSNHSTKDGWLGELALDYLLTRNIALEVSAGYGLFDTKSNGGKKKSVTFVPLTGTVMFRLPVYDKFFPYVGAGYAYKMFSGGPNGMKIANSNGFVLQAGTDIFFEGTNAANPIGFNVDLKYYLKTNAKISESVPGAVEKFPNKMSEFTIMGGIVVPL